MNRRGSPTEAPAARAIGRGLAFLMDALLFAYVLWALDRLGLGGGDLSRYPLLCGLAPVFAAAAQAANASLGLLAFERMAVEPTGRRAEAARRAMAAVVSAVGGLVVVGVGSAAGFVPALVSSLVLVFVATVLPGGRSLPERVGGIEFVRARRDESEAMPALWTRPGAWLALVVLGLTFAVGWRLVEATPERLFEGGEGVRRLVRDLLDIDLSIVPDVIERMVETIFVALLASAFALPFAFALSFVGARNVTRGSLPGRVAYGATRLLMNVTRSIEPLVWVVIFSIWVGVGPFAGLLALWIHSVAALGKLYSEAIEGIDPGPVEALQATGASPLAVLRYGVVPQVVPPFLGFTVYRWDINVRMATILGLVGGGGIGDRLLYYQQVGQWPKVGTILLFITLVVWLMDVASSRVRQRIV